MLAYYLWKLCKDDSLKHEFDKADADPHTANAERWGLPRKIAKKAVFLLIYGGGAGLLSRRANISEADAKSALNTIHSEQPAIRKLMDKVVARCKEQGYIITLGGRHIHYPELRSKDKDAVARASRQCFNALIQGGARDVLHRLAIESYPVVQKYNGSFVNVVHDECITEFLCTDAEYARQELNLVWQNRWDLLPGVRVNGNWNIGSTWLEAK